MNKLQIPPYYRPGRYGPWNLVVKKPGPNGVTLRSYFSGPVTITDEVPTLLDRNGFVWMSVTPMELESQYFHNEMAYGHVWVMGLGLGVLPYNLCLNPKVTKITVIEKCRSLVKHFSTMTEYLQRWPGALSKMDIVLGDARKITGECDVLLADIWPLIGDTKVEKDMSLMRRNIKFQRMYCWSGEHAYITWAMKQRRKLLPETPEIWSLETGHSLYPDFMEYVRRSAMTAIY